jgi:hypothetical protein
VRVCPREEYNNRLQYRFCLFQLAVKKCGRMLSHVRNLGGYSNLVLGKVTMKSDFGLMKS